jgi:translocation and assembly module TamB
MRRRYRVLLWTALVLIGLPVLLLVGVYVTANTTGGRDWIERITARLTDGGVQLSGLGGHFPERLQLKRLELRDTKGLWLTADELELRWTPAALLSRRAQVELLQAAHVEIERAPAYPHKEKPSTVHHWPRVQLARLDVERLDLGAALVGNPVALQVQGSGSWVSLQEASLKLDARRLDAVPSVYRASAQFDEQHLQAQLDLEEDADGPLAHLAQVPTIGAVAIHLDLIGPREAVGVLLAVRAGALKASAGGTLNARTGAAAFEVSLDAGAMTPRPGVAWEKLHLSGRWRGPMTAPETSAQLEAAGLTFPGVQLPQLTAQLSGQSGSLTLDARANGMKLPGRVGPLLASSPVTAHALLHLDQPGRPLEFTLSHALVTGSGHWHGGGADGVGNLTANITDLKPFAAIAALNLEGRGTLEAQLHTHANVRTLELSSALQVGGHSPVALVLAPKSNLSVTLNFDQRGLEVTRSQLTSGRAQASAHGRIDAGVLDLSWKAALSDVSALSPRITGNASAQGVIQGEAPRLLLNADLDGQLALNGGESGALRVKLRVHDLPQRPVGELQFTGTLDQAPVDFDVTMQGEADGALLAKVEHGSWKSLLAQGELNLPGDSKAPQGHLELSMQRMEDLDRLVGQALQGSIQARVDFDGGVPGGRARVRVDAKDAGVPAQQFKELHVAGDIDGLATEPTLALHLTGRTLISQVPANLKAQIQGPLSAVALHVSADSEGDVDTHALMTTVALLDTGRREVRFSELQLLYHGQTVRLLSPALVSFADGVHVERLRLGMGDSVWQLDGRLTPEFDLTASAHNLTPDLLRSWLPNLQADGQLNIDVELHGSLAQPTGSVRIEGRGLRARSGSVRGLPAGEITIGAQLQGTVAQVELQGSVGDRLQVHASGQAPLNRTAPMAIKANGKIDLVLLNPILEAGGQRLSGEATLDAEVAGTPAAPQAHGTLVIAKADVQDFPRGLHLTDIDGTLTADGDEVRLKQFVAHAAPGTISISGSLGLGTGLPLSLKVEAHNARPLNSDLIKATVDMNLTVSGLLRQKLDAVGSLHIDRADLTIPNALPPNVAVLDVRRPGVQPQPPRPNALPINLDFTVDAPRAVFVQGRGVTAELGGTLHAGGTSLEPNISGGFDMRSGTISLAGSTLTFTSGRVSFNGTGVKKRIDPTLDFTATNISNGVTYTLNVGGYADAPVITLSSSPEQPQDQILSRLMFGADPAQLSTLQVAQIAAALAAMSGIGSGGGFSLSSVQRALRLDRLAFSGGSNAAPTAAGPSAQGTNTGASIEAGRYVSSRVYVGAKQFTTGTTQAQVQVDLTKALKVQTALATGGGPVQGVTPQNDPGSSIGLSYQFEY